MLDSQSIKTSAQRGPKGFDMAKEVKGRKRHLFVDVLGLLLAVRSLPADVQDCDGATPLVGAPRIKCLTFKKMYVDDAYSGDCAQMFRKLYQLDAEAVRRPGSAWSWAYAGQSPTATAGSPPFLILPRRWVVECTRLSRAPAATFQRLRSPPRILGRLGLVLPFPPFSWAARRHGPCPAHPQALFGRGVGPAS